MISHLLKNVIFQTACMAGVDTLFRHLNLHKLLVVMYHGVSRQPYASVWNQIPVDTFRRQLEFLRSHYRFVTLGDVVSAISNHSPLPERAVLITFDDGLKNNYAVAFPVLRNMGIPAAIFLTTDFVGTDNMLWFDELFFLLSAAALHGIALNLPQLDADRYLIKGSVWKSYEIVVEALKRSGSEHRSAEMARLKQLVPFDRSRHIDDFGLMQWDEIRGMHRTGLIDFGVHTATHRIISELADGEWKNEILLPKHHLESELGVETSAFCFPNGRPSKDFRPEHLAYLREAGYACAFTTESALFPLHEGDSMKIGRISAGNDVTSEEGFFRLNTSGAIRFIRDRIMKFREAGFLESPERVNERSTYKMSA